MARRKAKPSGKAPVVCFTAQRELIERVDGFAATAIVPVPRSAAIRRLIEIGLDAIEKGRAA